VIFSLDLFEMLESTCFFGKTFVTELRKLQSEEKKVLVRKLWALPKSKCGHLDGFACSTFVDYVADELERVGRHGRLFTVQDFRGTFAMIEELSANASRTYNDILAELSRRYPNDHPDAVRRSIELTVRLWLTLDIHSDSVRVGAESDRTPINWDLSQSLDDLLRDQPRGRTTTQRYGASARFDRRLTAAYLVKTCGISFQWSDCIATHLDFDLDRLILTIYRHKATLISHLVSPQRSPVPKELLEEVISTMDLLFPFGDEPTRDLLFKEDQRFLYTLGGNYKIYSELDLAR
jgi:hypothetical protein